MKPAAVSVALLLGCVPLAGQTIRSGTADVTGLKGGVAAYTPAQVSSGCPVWMRVQQTPGGQLETVENGKRKVEGGTQLNLTVNARMVVQSPKQVSAAALTVYGFSGSPQFEPVGSAKAGASSASGEPARTLDVHFTPTGDGSAAAEAWVAGIEAVSWLEVNSIVYSDGSTWRPATGQSCRIKPDPFELISVP